MGEKDQAVERGKRKKKKRKNQKEEKEKWIGQTGEKMKKGKWNERSEWRENWKDKGNSQGKLWKRSKTEVKVIRIDKTRSKRRDPKRWEIDREKTRIKKMVGSCMR